MILQNHTARVASSSTTVDISAASIEAIIGAGIVMNNPNEVGGTGDDHESNDLHMNSDNSDDQTKLKIINLTNTRILTEIFVSIFKILDWRLLSICIIWIEK